MSDDPFGAARDIGDLFVAGFDSELDCGHYAYAGDPVAYVPFGLVCFECREEALQG